MIDAPLREVASFRTDINAWWHKRTTVSTLKDAAEDFFFLECDEWFGDVRQSEQIYAPGVDAYLYYSRASLQACEAMGWIPDVVHCHDWHTGFVPVLMRSQHSEAFDDAGCVFTIHNLAYQGEFEPNVLDRVGIPASYFNLHQVEAHGAVNFLKSGAVFSDMTNTVSETYAEEIQTPTYGCRLDGLMRHLYEDGRLFGIVNGIDQVEWNPATDLTIAANFDADHPEAKSACRSDLLKRVGLEPIEGAPVAGVVSRLSSQKGMDVMLATSEDLFRKPMQLIVQGLGDPWLADEFEKLQRTHPKHFRFVHKFDVEMAQRIYAGADMFLMPSAFEPCGLGQLIAMRYGTAPIVRRTGGLADTVRDGTNGFVFDRLDATDFLDAVDRAIERYRDPASWSVLIANALRHDSSWSKSAKAYEKLYAKAVMSRRADQAVAI